MRTTVDLPTDLLRAAKEQAASRGESLKRLFARALANELGSHGLHRRKGRVQLPLIESERPGSAELTNTEIEAVLAAEDAGAYGSDR